MTTMLGGSVDEALDGMAARLRAGRLSSAELVEECLRRIEADRTINAVVELDADTARESARKADRLLRRHLDDVGALCGIPVTVKRTFEVRGFAHVEADVEPGARCDVPASREAVVVARLRAAGAVVLGRTNAPARAADIDTWHVRYGRTRHPHDPARSPGGSSGGSAVAVAVGHTAFDIGSDVAGSARIPAHACGVFALRPTAGSLPTLGHVPGPVTELDTVELLEVCPITRRAEDLTFVWRAIGGRAGTRRVVPRHAPIAAVLSDRSGPLSAAVAARLHEGVECLRRAGFPVEDVELPVDLAENWLLCQELLYDTSGTAAPVVGVEPPAPGADPIEVALWCAGMSHRQWRRLDRERNRLRARWQRFFARYAALLLPVLGTTALPPRDQRVPLLADRVAVDAADVPLFSLSTWCALASVAGLPAVSMPVPDGSGLPVGMQVVAGHRREEELLDLVERFAGVLNPEPGT